MRNSTYKGFLKLKEIKSQYDLPKLIFFGSEVYGIPTVSSDIDIAVVISQEDKAYKVKEKIYEVLEECDFKFEIDLICIEESNTKEYPLFDVRKDIFEKGWCV